MKIAIVSSEAVPFSKTGGLADVAGALFKVFSNMGQGTYLFSPYYKKTKETFKDPVNKFEFSVEIDGKKVKGFANIFKLYENGTAILIEEDEYFRRDGLYGERGVDYSDNALRFGFFNKAVLKVINLLDLKLDILHVNDWQTGLLPLFIKDRGLKLKTLFTIHNLAYQGNFESDYLERLGIDPKYFTIDGVEFYGSLSFMKAGIVFADKISTVSPTYAKEILTKEFGERLEGILLTRKKDLVGILNGIDTDIWNPETDTLIYKNFNKQTLELKEDNKSQFLNEIGLKNLESPLFGMVSRLASQKGVDILAKALTKLLKENINVVILGTGEKPLEEKLRALGELFPEKFKLFFTFDESLAHKIYASSDFFFMPSKYEPCGLGQMIALRYATLPIVHATGGLKDTVDNFSEITGCGNGFSFEEYSEDELEKLTMYVINLFKNKDLMMKLKKVAKDCNFSWENSAKQYLKLYEGIRNEN